MFIATGFYPNSAPDKYTIKSELASLGWSVEGSVNVEENGKDSDGTPIFIIQIAILASKNTSAEGERIKTGVEKYFNNHPGYRRVGSSVVMHSYPFYNAPAAKTKAPKSDSPSSNSNGNTAPPPPAEKGLFDKLADEFQITKQTAYIGVALAAAFILKRSI